MEGQGEWRTLTGSPELTCDAICELFKESFPAVPVVSFLNTRAVALPNTLGLVLSSSTESPWKLSS